MSAAQNAHEKLDKRKECSVDSLEELSSCLPWGEDELIDFTDSLAGTVVVTSGPLGLSVGGVSLDLSEVRFDGLDDLDLPVWVVLGSLDDLLLSSVGIVDSFVLRVGVAGAGILKFHRSRISSFDNR